MGTGDLSLPAARRAFEVVSSYWPLLSTAECTAIRQWLASLDHTHDLDAQQPRSSHSEDRLDVGQGQLLCTLDSENLRLSSLIPDRILRSHAHPFLRQVSDGGRDRVDPMMRQQMIADLRRWQAVNAHLPDIGGMETMGAQSLASDVADPFHLGCPPWSPDKARAHLLADFRDIDDWGDLVDPLAAFVQAYGTGDGQGCVCYRFEGNRAGAYLQPIHDFAAFDLSWLEGNRKRIAVLEENTRHLLDGYRAHNTLIWGPRGCGKSSVIRGLITRHWDAGLRGIEVPYRSLRFLPQLFDLVRGRRHRFIAVLDNIGMDRTDPFTRILSTSLDGGLESTPNNLVFYATSNFKDLVDREGERPKGPPAMQADDTPVEIRHTDSQSTVRRGFDPQGFQRLDERRGLDDRFPLKVFIDLPTKTEYDRMVVAYARRAGIDVPEADLLSQFQIWRLRNNHDLVGGRTARDFILSCYPVRDRRAG